MWLMKMNNSLFHSHTLLNVIYLFLRGRSSAVPTDQHTWPRFFYLRFNPIGLGSALPPAAGRFIRACTLTLKCFLRQGYRNYGTRVLLLLDGCVVNTIPIPVAIPVYVISPIITIINTAITTIISYITTVNIYTMKWGARYMPRRLGRIRYKLDRPTSESSGRLR